MAKELPKSLIARMARQHGPKLIDQAMNRLDNDVLGGAPSKKPSLSSKIAGGILVRIATRSVPGAIIVGGGLLAKHLYDRKKAKPKPPTT